ncbi:TRAP transporter small permease [Pseudoroseomonas globiformis]|uniref:TRAP transporter small permease protein n=1 Tax=Teichococcus globiformis TaxID=2307229 RepID=A0ABV7FZA6_9PROT
MPPEDESKNGGSEALGVPHDGAGIVPRMARALMLAGGLVLLGVALVTSVSVGARTLTGQPVAGDFELVQTGSGLAILGFLAYGSLRRSNIMVDSMTSWLPRRVNALVDMAWSVVWAACSAGLAWGMALGARDAWISGTRTMVLGVGLWWPVALGAVAFVVVGLAALHGLPQRWRDGAR